MGIVVPTNNLILLRREQLLQIQATFSHHLTLPYITMMPYYIIAIIQSSIIILTHSLILSSCPLFILPHFLMVIKIDGTNSYADSYVIGRSC